MSILVHMNNDIFSQSLSGALPIITPINDLCPIFFIPENQQINEYRKRASELFEKDNYHQQVCKLLEECIYSEDRTYEKAKGAIDIIKTCGLHKFDYYCLGLVYYPDLLEEYLEYQELITEEDLISMFCVCIEHNPDDKFMRASLECLIKYVTHPLEIKLLPGKYTIDNELYSFIKEHGVQDSYYDAVMNAASIKYNHPDIITLDKNEPYSYTRFRDAYHALIYGDSLHLQALIVKWDIGGDDSTTDAARDYFHLGLDCPIDTVKDRVTALSNVR